MMILGMFVFSLPTLAYQELQRQTDWKHPSNSIVGGRDQSQFTGKGDDIITLNGWIAPELTGSIYSLDALRFMADTGKAWILIQGTGRIFGHFVITNMSEGKTHIANNGNPERIDFSITLKRVDESVPDMLSKLGDISNIKNRLSLDGLMNGF
jgi:phage protein U